MTKLLIGFLFFASISLFSCNSNTTQMIKDSTKNENVEISFTINRDSILKIAEKNAKTAYRDLSIYNVNSELKDDKWYVDYNLSDPEMNGGGPHYIISAKTGEILSFRYEQ